MILIYFVLLNIVIYKVFTQVNWWEIQSNVAVLKIDRTHKSWFYLGVAKLNYKSFSLYDRFRYGRYMLI